jgi:uncharacterized protein (DUF427 family)
MATGHRITITPSDVHVEVMVGGERVAASDRPVLLDETGLPTRYYLPPEDIRTDLLRPSSRTSRCPFKGEASYWSVKVDGKEYGDVAWSYEQPIPGAGGIAGLICFYPERVEIRVDRSGAGVT